MGIPRPIELREDEVFLADNPHEVTLDFDAAATLELGEAVVLPLADNEIDFDEAFIVDDIEGGLA